MRRQQWLFVFCVTVSSWIFGCNPYTDRLNGEFNAGSADPFDYAPPYRGTASTFSAATNQATLGNPGARQITGGNRIHETRAFVGGTQTGYYRFPFSPSQITTTFYNPVTTPPASYSTPPPPPNPNFLDPATFTSLRVSGPGSVPSSAGPPLVYVFDPPQGTGPIPPISNSKQCRTRAGYSYDPFRDDVRYDEQGNIFTLEPTANFPLGALPNWTYVPVVREVAVTSGGEICQDIKSEATLLKRPDQVTVPTSGTNPDGTPIAVPDGRYLAWAMIEPGTAVYRVGENPNDLSFGLGAQRFGWFQQFLVAYLDGGAIPTTAGPVVTGQPTSRMVTQRLFYPRSIGTASGTACAANGCLLGGGVTPYQSNDVLEFTREQTGYSPVCQVITYALPAATQPPRDAATIQALYGATFQPPPAPPAGSCGANGLPTSANPGCVTPTFIFCLQIS